MRFSRMERALAMRVLQLAGAIMLIVVASTGSEAGRSHKASRASVSNADLTALQTVTVQPQKPIRLRYFGGPKSMMSAQ